MSHLAQFFQDWGTLIQTIALVATLCIIIWYACETKKLREVTVKQTELQLTPYIILDYKDDLICKNIGNSSAINVEVSTFEAIGKDSGKLVFKVSFPPLYVIEPKEEKKVEPEIKFEDKELEDIVEALEFAGTKFFPFFPKETRKDEYPLIIDYENIENVPYRTSVLVKCRENKIQILNIERVGQAKRKKGANE